MSTSNSRVPRATLAARLRSRWLATSPMRVLLVVVAIGVVVSILQRAPAWFHHIASLMQVTAP